MVSVARSLADPAWSLAGQSNVATRGCVSGSAVAVAATAQQASGRTIPIANHIGVLTTAWSTIVAKAATAQVPRRPANGRVQRPRAQQYPRSVAWNSPACETPVAVQRSGPQGAD